MGDQKRKILVIDDNQEFVDLVRRILGKEDFYVSVALNGKTGIEKILTDKPELVLLDLKLPDISGEELLRKIKDIDRNIAVVIVTGFGGEQIAVDLMRKGATDFLSKPIDHDILLKSINNSLAIRDAQIEESRFDGYSSLERFFPFLAHEIRNPLHAISGALTIIKRRSNLKDQLISESIKIIDDEVQHLNNFVQECLNFVRPSNRIRFSELDVNEVVSIAINITSHMFDLESKKIKVSLEKHPDLPKIYGNYEEIKQAFINIVRNAIESMNEGGRLVVKTFKNLRDPQYVQVFFIDNGPGIKRENLPFIFQPFFTTKQRGTGLGLAICKKIIVDHHRGKIEIESEENKGTTIRVELPINRG
jgi:signal transduction histidine kinase